MKKSSLLTALFLMFSFMGFAQEWHGITSDSPTKMKKTLVSSTENEVVVNINIDGFYTQNVMTPNGKQVVVSADRMASMLEAGAPDLPMAPVPVIIGDRAEMRVDVVNSTYVDFENIEVAPSKGNFSRQINPDDVPYTYGEMYQKDAFWPATPAYLESPYILRDFRGQNIMVRPFAYNPVTKTLRVYTSMTIAMTKVSDNGENQKASRKSNTIGVDPDFKATYENTFINFGETGAKYDFIVDQGSMLVVCVDAYLDAIQPLVDWKNLSGRPCTMVASSTTGTDTQLKSYIQNYYAEHPELTYILLVGEHNNLPGHYQNGGRSDIYYGMLEGSDLYAEALVGRFSPSNYDDAANQANRTIYYERDVPAGATWCNHGMGIGHTDGPGHYGETDWQHIDKVRDTLMHYTYTQVTQRYVNYNTVTNDIISQDINDGISIANYCNHGSATTWAATDYSTSHVNALVNDYMLPYVISVACNNGQFDVGECFGESWMRSKNEITGAPCGAIGGMFSWISQPWQPPMYGQDEMNRILTEWIGDFHHTMGAVSINGSMFVHQSCPSDQGDTYTTWILFGDPSLMLRTDTPTDMNVTANPSVLMLGMNTLTIDADADFGIATLSMDGEVIASGEVINGTCTLSFPELSSVGDADLVVLGYNKVTHVGTVEIVPAEGAYMSVNAYEMSAPANYGETVDLSIEFKNVGVETANNVAVTLSSDSEYINITSGEATIASINAGATVTLDGFQFEVAENAIDGMRAQINATMTDGTDTWTGKVLVELHAPVITMSGLLVAEDAVTFTFSNEGSAPFHGGEMLLTSCSPDLVFDPESQTFTDDVMGGESIELSFQYSFDESVEPGSVFEVAYDMTSGLFNTNGIFQVGFGSIGEDFESGLFGSGWSFTPVNNAWTIVDGGTKGTKCAKSTNEGISSSDYSAILTVDIAAAGDMSFMYKVSSETGSSTMWDNLTFYYDGQQKGQWAGTSMTDFAQFVQPVTTGTHTFKWTYHKDGSVNSGQDCAWIDDIKFPPTNVYGFIDPATNLEAVVDGHNVNLTWDASADAVSYVVKRDGQNVGAVTTTTFADVVAESGTYKYQVYALNDGGSMSAPVTVMVTVTFTGVDENEVVFGVYPNPADNVLYINSNAESFEYQVINSVGQVMLSGIVNGNAELNVSDLENGVYFLKVIANGNAKVEKVVIK